MPLQLQNQRLDVRAHQIELMHVVVLGRMDRNFRWRQFENQPSMPHIHTGKLEYIPQKGPVRFRILAVDNRVRTDDHGNDLLCHSHVPTGRSPEQSLREQHDPRTVPSAHFLIAGIEDGIGGFRQCDVGGVVGGKIVPQFPDTA